MALVGESGCGKTVLALAILGLLPRTARTSGAVLFNGCDLLEPAVARSLRGREIARCWSNAGRYFNPVTRVGRQIHEAYLQHHPGEQKLAREKTMGLLRDMGFTEPDRVHDSYPFQLSGGMNQRAMIAMSLINRPQLLLVGEPTRGLDDESRDCVLGCLGGISGVSMLVISHGVGMVGRIAHRVFFMRGGRILDRGPCPETLAVNGIRENPLARIGTMCALMNLEPALASRYPFELSAGQVQRFALARVFMLEPKFVLLDEPTSSMDPINQAQILEQILAWRRHHGLAALFIGHSRALLARVCDRILTLEAGS